MLKLILVLMFMLIDSRFNSFKSSHPRERRMRDELLHDDDDDDDDNDEEEDESDGVHDEEEAEVGANDTGG